MKQNKLFYILALTFLVLIVYCAYAYDLPKWFPFNEKNALHEWQEKIFRNKVLYVIEIKQKDGYLSASSQEACSGLLYKMKFNVAQFPMMSWQWQVTQFPDKTKKTINVKNKAGWIEQDDYAARVYVIFPSWNFLNIKSLEYVWDETLPEGTVVTSPYSPNIKLIVAESGQGNLNQWVQEERNIFEDYKKAFGKKASPSLNVGAIALMTDADNTASTAEAFYKDIRVRYKK